MKIAIFLPTVNAGGAEIVFIRLANQFSLMGHDVSLVLIKKTGHLENQISKRVSIIELKSKRLLLCLPELTNVLRLLKPDVTLSGLQIPNMICAFSHSIIRSRSKLILVEHSDTSTILSEAGWFWRGLRVCIQRFAYDYADAVVAVSQGVKHCLVERYKIDNSNVQVIYNPIDLNYIKEKSKEPTRHPWLKTVTTPVLVSVGRLAKEKRHSTLLHSISEINKSTSVRLIIIGDGEERHGIQKLVDSLNINDKVDIIGFRENPYSYMAESNGLVLSSTREGFSNVLLEALALNTPVVSTDCPSGPSEILEEGKWGQLVPMEDINAMSEAIIKMITDGNSNTVHRAQEFSVDKIATKYQTLFFSFEKR